MAKDKSAKKLTKEGKGKGSSAVDAATTTKSEIVLVKQADPELEDIFAKSVSVPAAMLNILTPPPQ